MVLAVVCQLLINYTPNNHHINGKSLSAFGDLKNTFGFLEKNLPILFIIIIQAICIFINTGLWRVGLPIYLENYLNEDITSFGYITGIMGASSFLTSIFLGAFNTYKPVSAFNIGIILWGVGLVVLGLFPSIQMIYFCTILIGVGQASQGLTRVVILQEQVPRNMLGKVFSTSSSINYASDTLSLGTISSILALLSTAASFLSGGIIILIIGMLGTMILKRTDLNRKKFSEELG